MAKRLLILFSLFILMTFSSCSLFANRKTESTPQPTPTGMERYYGEGMSIMLPPSYEARDVQDDLPAVIDIIKKFTGGDEGLLGGLLENVEKNVAWWGWDSETIEENPLRLLVIKNKALHALPLTAAAFGLERLLNQEGVQVEQSTVRLGERSMVRFKYQNDEVAWVAYAFKEQELLWISLFIFTPEGMIGAQESIESSMGTIMIDPIKNVEN